ncbi:hypothetical protein ACP275_14G058600 [Erythranthe tilingii]
MGAAAADPGPPELNRRDEDGYFGKDDIKRAVEKVTFEFADDDQSWKTVRENHKKWRSFLLDRIAQDNLITSLVKEMEAIAGISSARK